MMNINGLHIFGCHQRTGLCAGVAFIERQARNKSRLKN